MYNFPTQLSITVSKIQIYEEKGKMRERKSFHKIPPLILNFKVLYSKFEQELIIKDRLVMYLNCKVRDK